MENSYEKYKNLHVDGRLLSLAQGEIAVPYFCYPVNAKVIGFEGCILYCFLPEYENMVFASNPESCADRNVYPLAKDFSDFMRLILACGSANSIEQIVWMNQAQFEQHVKEERAVKTEEQEALLILLSKELKLSPMRNPFEYVKSLQADFDDSQIKYSDEYYDVLGIERPF